MPWHEIAKASSLDKTLFWCLSKKATGATCQPRGENKSQGHTRDGNPGEDETGDQHGPCAHFALQWPAGCSP